MDITPTTICGSDLAADTAALQWYEAVAFVLQLAEAIKRVGVACAPDLPHVQLSTDGTVAIPPRAQWADQPVRRLAVTLKLLLQHAEVPPELGQVIAQAAEGIAHTFNSAVERWFGIGASTEASSASDSAPPPPETASPARVSKRRPRELGGFHLAVARRAATADMPQLVPASTSPISADAVVLPPPNIPQTRLEPDPEPGRIYSRLDPGVVPPVLLWPFIGRIVADASAMPGDMDIVVGRTGDVERVTLLVPNRYQDRMLIYAMKNRQFTPAVANGRPVRYALRVRTGSPLIQRVLPVARNRGKMSAVRVRLPGGTAMRHAFILVIVLASVAVACQNKPTDPTAPSATAYVPAASLVTIAESSTVEQVTAGQTATSNNYLGQSVSVPGGPSYNNIRFNWDGTVRVAPLTPGARGPLAVGALFILTQEYLGLPGNLGTSTPGFLAQTSRVEQGQYVFAPSVTLEGGTKYWFYAYWAPGSAGIVSPITGFSEDAYGGGDMYIAPELGGSFAPLPFRKALASWRVISFGPPIEYYKPPAGTCVDANFRLMGAPAGQ